jgi:hypothetical protein
MGKRNRKRAVARSIHRKSGGARAFVEVKCAAIPESDRKRAFGMKKAPSKGRLEEAGKFDLANEGPSSSMKWPTWPEGPAKILRISRRRTLIGWGATGLISKDAGSWRPTTRTWNGNGGRRFRQDRYYR